ncbi:hypothetical protein I3F58_21725 [Streptomyces sp. MUM 203J]|uniref:hypothetical protein n=1 Tax=Streptomyces sp. MUM 203J TaxID=2791990 RepID=UPI001F0341E7|nr:hypothetical protein [Streptomyces sp. MUM 203J]MCH0542129.1 hypothetical protein [Streptomyces sp. MUM 203J]
MPRTGDRRGGAAVSGAVLAALSVLAVVVALMCVRPSAAASVPAVGGAPADAVAVAVAADLPPGCGDGSPSDEGGLSPAAPPRGMSAGELLPAPYGTKAGPGAGCGPGTVTAITPERAPPPLVPPSPVDLSILRV